MFQVSVLFSGSKGNSILVKTEGCVVLFDVGVSGKKLFHQLENLGISPSDISAIVVSHEHFDHICGVGVALRKLKIPLFITKKTFSIAKRVLGKLPIIPTFFDNGDSFDVGDLTISSFASSHDAVDPSCFTITQKEAKRQKLAIVTDIGYISRLLIQRLHGTTSIVLEANHDEQMLFDGTYPWELKRRIKGRLGHLSNDEASGLIQAISADSNLKNIILAHISQENNQIKKARASLTTLLASIRLSANLVFANQNRATKLIEV